MHRTSIKPCKTYAYGPIQPLFSLWWYGTSGDHPKKDLGLLATSYWKTFLKNRKSGWKTSLILMVPYSPFFSLWWYGTSGDHPKKDLGFLATSYWKTFFKNRKSGWKTSLNASNLSKYGELFFEVLSNSVKFLRICKRMIFFKLLWVQFCTSSLGKKVALVYSVAFYFFWWYIAQMRKSKFKFL